MAHHLRYLISTLALTAGFLAALHGQNEPPRAAKLRFTVFSPEPVAGLSYVVAVQPERRLLPLVFFPSSRSPVYDYAGPRLLQFVDSQSGKIVAWVEVPAEIKEPLLVFFPLVRPTADGRRFQLYVHDDARSKHGGGGLAVLNFSGLALSGTIDRKVVELTDGYHGPFAVGASARVQLSTLFHARRIQTYADTIALGKDGRALLILLPPFRKGSLEVQSRVLLDEVTPEQAAKLWRD